ncbi:hypothetical protein ACFOD9_13920 [Novosphingobium bradum]|uniref:Flagellar hook-length control protein FliK n=1 Tax=Novosphingobium bradum TaxID=1737444 RepID=A0ABV7IRQ2_9SPHN
MINPAAPPTASSPAGTLSGSGGILAAPGNSADPAAFAALLAHGEGAAPASPAPAALPLAAIVTPAADRQDLAALPASAMATGKPLPDPAADPAGNPATHPAAGLPVPVLPLLRAVRLRDAAEATPPAQAEPADDGASTPAPANDPEAAAPALPALVLTLAPPAQAAPDPASTQPGAPAATLLPPAIAAQVLGQPLPGQPQPAQPQPTAALQQQAAVARAEERSLRLPASPAPDPAEGRDQAQAPQFTLASPAAPAASEALRLRPVIDHGAKAALADAVPTAMPMPAPTADSTGAAPAAAGPAMSPAATGPAPTGFGHDFGAVVDRLMAAREAARADSPAQTVALNLRHAEFGEVSVRFEQRADGLSVALASPDPDFARAVQAAAPSAGSADAGQSGSTGPGANGPLAQAGTGSGSGAPAQQGQRGNGTAQAGRFPGPGRDGAGEPATATPPGSARARGIYA